ncbi:hypothetical protein PHYSODRAFT_516976 [Phytophthora sojae]|uniref:Uncharacterized protein n=1 Tax=Phytophthora sojae (strain P6497) TaxID=1094619 RepID=G4ZVG8_PHYSP|nr:hypothetical protein PHYSODRAFT_516976 [Phytophthora sojae]EGZ11486.1 hypothetical protein PHYSODRAFT_516976 [Phytophthora sojae]|eukprot:XP_009531819.1 hypothetical protein PHYSODRAFT_516976 [Phytophthora sojae]
MERWATDSSEADYWIPASSLCGTVDAVAKWTFPDVKEHFCFLRLTSSSAHEPNFEILRSLLQLFVAKKLPVCSIVLLLDKNKVVESRPSALQTAKAMASIPVYVGHVDLV